MREILLILLVFVVWEVIFQPEDVQHWLDKWHVECRK